MKEMENAQMSEMFLKKCWNVLNILTFSLLSPYPNHIQAKTGGEKKRVKVETFEANTGFFPLPISSRKQILTKTGSIKYTCISFAWSNSLPTWLGDWSLVIFIQINYWCGHKYMKKMEDAQVFKILLSYFMTFINIWFLQKNKKKKKAKTFADFLRFPSLSYIYWRQ